MAGLHGESISPGWDFQFSPIDSRRQLRLKNQLACGGVGGDRQRGHHFACIPRTWIVGIKRRGRERAAGPDPPTPPTDRGQRPGHRIKKIAALHRGWLHEALDGERAGGPARLAIERPRGDCQRNSGGGIRGADGLPVVGGKRGLVEVLTQLCPTVAIVAAQEHRLGLTQ